MISKYEHAAATPSEQSAWELVSRIIAWLIVTMALLNVLCFVLGTANPVLRSDDWYFFETFVQKAIDGTLGFADFFVKRHGADHAQPLSKLVLWFEWRYLDLDVAFESIVGVASALACGLILHRFVMASRGCDGRNAIRQVAWCVMCVLLLSLNSSGVWTWPLVALGYLTLVPALLFIWAAWHALRSGRYGVLALATSVLGVIGDDSAIIVVVVILVALLWVLLRDPGLRRGGVWRLFCIIAGCLILVRIGYVFAPVVGGSPSESLTVHVSRLLAHAGHWWQWISVPLALSVAYENPFGWISSDEWAAIQLVMAALLVLAHVAFWRRAFSGNHNLTTFAAVSLMLMSYAWLVAVLVYRVSHFGTDYLHQARYVQLYLFNLVALLLMWAGPHSRQLGWRGIVMHIPAIGCALLLAIQVPLALGAWHFRPYLLEYYRRMAMQIAMAAAYPEHDVQCVQLLPVCQWPADKRARALGVLKAHRLNVFSPRVQQWHLYLPQTDDSVEQHGTQVDRQICAG